MKGQHEDDQHVECVSDFNGSRTHPGAWADLFKRPDGTRYLQLGGGWAFYGEHTPEVIEESNPHFTPFRVACDMGTDFGYAKKHWD